MQSRAAIPRTGWAAAFLAAAVLAVTACNGPKSPRPSHDVSPRLQPLRPAPDFHLLDQTGKPFGLADLKGKIWVAYFLFTRCKAPCPLISSRMAELHKMLERTGGSVVLVSFSTDPEFDRPEILARYAAALGADSSRWKFLTGSKEDIDSLSGNGLLRPLAGEVGGTPVHSTCLVLVDREGRLRGFEDGSDPEVVQKLLMDIGDLMRENPSRDP